jgi:aspartate racemase
LVTANDLDAVIEYVVSELEKLARAGVDFGAISSNTPHIVFDQIRSRSPIPLISIVETTCAAARKLGVKRLGLFGTRFTMQGRFYPDVCSRSEMTIVLPDQNEQTFIHDKYMSEFVSGIFLPETRVGLLEIVERMKVRDGIDALILGGTELPLILRSADVADAGIPFLDTGQIHCEAIVAELLSNEQ